MSSIATTLDKIEARRRRLLGDSPIIPPLITLVVMFVFFSALLPHFRTMQSISGIIGAASINAIVVAGVTILMIAGEFDLSVGSMLAMGGLIFGRHIMGGGSAVTGLFMAIAATGVMGLVNGLLTISTRIPSFIVTLGTRQIYRGVVWIVSGGVLLQGVSGFPLYDVFNGRLHIVNNLFTKSTFTMTTVWAVGVMIVAQFALTRTRFGNHIFATGGNPEAAVAQGVNARLVKVLCFTIVGVLCGIAGALTYAQFQSIFVATGRGLELTAIASAVVGGTVLTGGVGSIVGGMLGILLINMLRSGVILLGLPSDNFEAIVGLTIIASAVLIERMRGRL